LCESVLLESFVLLNLVQLLGAGLSVFLGNARGDAVILSFANRHPLLK
jgi:hypothetical protein